MLLLFQVRAAAQGNFLLETGRVVGHVYLADMNKRPARLAKVRLRPAGKGVRINDSLAVQMMWSSVTTDMNGTFIIPNLRPGSYYVLVDFPGYQSDGLQFTENELRNPTPELLKTMEQSIPKVTVETGLTAHIEIALQRGAVINGAIRYDDGSPASGAVIRALRKEKDGDWRDQSEDAAQAISDDLGNFRLSGLRAGKFIVKCSLQTVIDQEGYATPENHLPTALAIGQKVTLDIYSGGGFRPKDAKVIELRSGEEITGVDAVVPLGKLHGVAGSITSFEDGHSLDFGNVELLFADDNTKFAETQVLRDGSFQFPLVPEGEYVLKVNASDVDYLGPGSSYSLQKTYEETRQPVTVSKDGENIVIQLKARSTQAPGS